MTGKQLVIPAAFSNSNYILKFLESALRCDPAEASFVHEVYEAYLKQLTSIENYFRYIVWVPVAKGRLNLTDSDEFLDLASTDTAHLYIIPNTSVAAGPVFVDDVSGVSLTPHDAHYGYQDFLDCKLYNASYQTDFNFSYPSQTIDIRFRTLLNSVNVSKNILG